MAAGWVLRSHSSSLWGLFSHHRGTAMLRMLCPVVEHLAERRLLFQTVNLRFESVTDNMVCVSWHFWLPRGQVYVCVCVCLCASDHFQTPTAFLSFSTSTSPRIAMFLQKYQLLCQSFQKGFICFRSDSIHQIHQQSGSKQSAFQHPHLCENEFYWSRDWKF